MLRVDRSVIGKSSAFPGMSIQQSWTCKIREGKGGHSTQARNEALARKAAAISEEDLEAVRGEAEARLGAAERKVYALTKERDALRRGADRLVSANDLVKEKDAIIQQARAWPTIGSSVSWLLRLHDLHDLHNLSGTRT